MSKPEESKASGHMSHEGIKSVTKNLPKEGGAHDAWNLSEKGKKAMAKANHMNQLKHGLYASIPILCKGEECPYSDACYIEEDERPKTDPCPIEASTIEKLVEDYTEDLGIDEDDAMARSMIRMLVSTDISITRCEKKLAVDPDIVKNVIVAVTEDGRPLTKPEIDKAYELQNKLARQRNQIMKDLLATPKSRAQIEDNTDKDPSSIVATMKKNLANYQEEGDEITVEVKKE
jgi:hypothetical protein